MTKLKVDELSFEWRTSQVKISKPPTTDMSPYDYEKKEFEYIDFLLNGTSLADILQLEGKTIGVFDSRSYNEDEVNDFLPIITKQREITLYRKPFGENMYDSLSIICSVEINEDIVTWKNFGIPNPAWTDPIDFLRPYNFNIKEYSGTLHKLFVDLTEKRKALRTSTK
jgi:hypothetical protein